MATGSTDDGPEDEASDDGATVDTDAVDDGPDDGDELAEHLGESGFDAGSATGLPLDQPEQRQAVADLRRDRRRRRLGDKEWGELAYRAYTTTLAAIVAVIFASGFIGDDKFSESQTATLVDKGPAWIGLLSAVIILMGVRSGSRGGPVALEVQDVHHLLLAPVDRGITLRRPTVGILAYGVLGGAVLGGLVAGLLDQRLNGAALPWFGSGAVFGAATMALALGAGLVTSSRVVNRWLMLALAWILVLWGLADATGYAPAAPTTFLGRIVVWPLHFDPFSLVPVPVAVALPIIGLLVIGGLSIEAARRRTALVGQLRFAVTQQDLRTVVLLRRQLASERPRGRPWFPGLPRPIARRFPVMARDIRSIARWPVVRVVRVVVLGIAAGLAARAMWSGTTPLIIVCGLVAYVAALDAEEPLAQDIDHPGLLTGQPVVDGLVLFRHLAEPVVVMIGVGVVAVATAYLVDPSPMVLQVGAIALLPAALAGVAGAAVTVVSEAILDSTSEAFIPPEVAGPRLLFRTAWPPAIAVIGFVPVLVARAAAEHGRVATTAAVTAGVPVVLLCAAVFGWVRFRADIHRSLAEAGMGGSS